MLIERSYSELGGLVMLVVGRVCMPYVVRSVEKRNGSLQVTGPILAFT